MTGGNLLGKVLDFRFNHDFGTLTGKHRDLIIQKKQWQQISVDLAPEIRDQHDQAGFTLW